MSRQVHRPIAAPATIDPARALATLWRARLVDTLRLALARLDDRKELPGRRIRKSRQATKVARALLRLAPRGLKRQALGARLALASVSKRLSPVRDTDSLLETLALAARSAGLAKAHIAALSKPLLHRRSTHGPEEARALGESHDILGKLLRQIEGWKLPSGGSAAILAAAMDDYRRLRRDAAELDDDTDIELVHEVRKRAIIHRHQWAFLASVAPRAAARQRLLRRADKLKAVHQAIGQHRDLALLADHLRPLATGKHAAPVAALKTAIAHLQGMLLNDAEARARRMVRHKPDRLKARLLSALKP